MSETRCACGYIEVRFAPIDREELHTAEICKDKNGETVLSTNCNARPTGTDYGPSYWCCLDRSHTDSNGGHYNGVWYFSKPEQGRLCVHLRTFISCSEPECVQSRRIRPLDRFRNLKNGETYVVVTISQHTERDERLVTYRRVDLDAFDKDDHSRPYFLFLEKFIRV
jgi:hypothetical protein